MKVVRGGLGMNDEVKAAMKAEMEEEKLEVKVKASRMIGKEGRGVLRCHRKTDYDFQLLKSKLSHTVSRNIHLKSVHGCERSEGKLGFRAV